MLFKSIQWHKAFGLFVLLLTAFSAQASDMGSPGLWFTVFLVASFLHCGTLYGLGALLFIMCSKPGQFNKKLAVGAPTVVVLLSFLVFMATGFAHVLTIGAAVIGWAVAFALHQWGMNKWLSAQKG